jgi:cellulose synthase/poly-beta-1,6-N-acetylglucosamine synthase-like glycosyltransferase/spore germination protein YaaH/peptidoglycan/xylan/chitin deacetylase (PgdA/CDA1 family)
VFFWQYFYAFEATMNSQKQIFQTSSRFRWNTFRWTGRLFLLILLLTIPVLWVAIAGGYKPLLPLLWVDDYKTNNNLAQPKGFSKKDDKKYQGIHEFLKLHQQNKLVAGKPAINTSKVRAAFYVDWDPQAFSSLKSHIDQLNMVMPEWFFIDPDTDTVSMKIDYDALALMKKQPGLKILPMLENMSSKKNDGDFDGKLLSAVLLDPVKRNRLLDDIARIIKQNDFQGINIDFEELEAKSVDAMHLFQKDLHERLHKESKLVTQDVPVGNEDFRIADLNKYNDYLFLMAYDQHYSTSVPGPLCDQRWIEKQLDEMAAAIPQEKIVLCLAAYGYDWRDGAEANTLTYQQALSEAKEFKSSIDFDNDSYNCTFEYKDNKQFHHYVSFIDAAGTFNSMRFADEYGAAGVALWRLGSEDERMWTFYGRDLDNDAIDKTPFDFSQLSTIDISNEKPDYEKNGEVLNLVNEPQKGIIDIEKDNSENVIAEEVYKQLPTRYVIKRYGEVQVKNDSGKVIENRVLLTFDDGPDPDYTPRILRILDQEKVPASFFIVGMNAMSNLPILKDISNKGYEIGNHSFTHPNMAEVSPARAETEMESTRLLIEAATGRSTILFRAPYNADAEPTRAVELMPVARSKQNSYYTVGESIDPEDWDTENGVNADSIYNRVVRQYEKDPSRGIILLHDAGGNREATVEALPAIIKYFKNKGVRFTSVSELLGLSKDSIMPPVHSNSLKVTSWVTVFVYWFEKFLYGAFWLAILLGLARIVFMGVLATLQYRRSKKEILLPAGFFPGKVSIIVPAFNEEVNAVNTVKNLLRQDYPDFEIIFVDDGSTDATYEMVAKAFRKNNRVKVHTKANGGKASALNFGVSLAEGKYIVCIDADTQLKTDAVRQMMYCFNNNKVGAVAGNVKVGNEKNILTRWQSIEYTSAQNFDRRAFDYINCITVVPGAIGAFSKEALGSAGGFTTDTLAEDCDLTIRILRCGYVIRNCSKAIAVTESPETMRQFMKQRFRWSYGVMQSFWKNKDACFNPKYKALGMVALPNILLFQVIMPVIAPIADLFFFFSIAWNWHDPNPASLHKILLYYGLFLFVDLAVSLVAFSFEKEKLTKLVWLLPQRFVYRQLMYIILFRSIFKAIKGEGQGWGVLKRTGNAQLTNPAIVTVIQTKNDKTSINY